MDKLVWSSTVSLLGTVLGTAELSFVELTKEMPWEFIVFSIREGRGILLAAFFFRHLNCSCLSADCLF